MHGIDIKKQLFVEYLGAEDFEIYSDNDFNEFIHSNETLNLFNFDDHQIIGEQYLGDFVIYARSTKNVYDNYIVKKKLLGFAIETEDQVDEHIYFKASGVP